MEELRWYLERFYLWPIGVFQERAAGLEAQLPQWGEQLYRAVMTTPSAQEAWHAWQHTTSDAERRFLDEAATAYEEAFQRDAARGDQRNIAANRFQLGNVRLFGSLLGRPHPVHHSWRARLHGSHLAANRHGAQEHPTG
jgi:hypothetical protein